MRTVELRMQTGGGWVSDRGLPGGGDPDLSEIAGCGELEAALLLEGREVRWEWWDVGCGRKLVG